MNWVKFQIAKLRRDEPALAQLAHLVSDDLRGRGVAVVGNARALIETELGARIDDADLVIRINSAPIPDPRSHGGRTDWIAMSTPVPASVLTARSPSRLLWMTPMRKRLPWRIARSDGFYLHPATEAAALRQQVGARPTTGLLLIDLLLRSDCMKIDLYGFDFFDSLSISGSRDAAQVPHDFAEERRWVHNAQHADPRLTLHQS